MIIVSQWENIEIHVHNCSDRDKYDNSEYRGVHSHVDIIERRSTLYWSQDDFLNCHKQCNSPHPLLCAFWWQCADTSEVFFIAIYQSILIKMRWLTVAGLSAIEIKMLPFSTAVQNGPTLKILFSSKAILKGWLSRPNNKPVTARNASNMFDLERSRCLVATAIMTRPFNVMVGTDDCNRIDCRYRD